MLQRRGWLVVSILYVLGIAGNASAAKPSASCGNGTIDPGEACEGTNLKGATCQSQGFPEGGTLLCTNCKLDTSGCYVCGNGVVQGPEQCDGTNLNGQTCQ